MKNNARKNEKKSNEINWDYSTDDGGIKCYVDKKNEVNVIVQKTFDYAEHEEPLNFYNNCTEQFYNNSFPIVIIESLNNGGYIYLSYYALTFIQVKLLPNLFLSVKYNNFMIEAMKILPSQDSDMINVVDTETCEKIDWDNVKKFEDNYGNNIIHKRTQTFSVFNSSELKEYKNRRQKYYELNHLKKPTEILIFTDAYSFSATSFFIKGLQETGGAITVGYYGNPEYPEEKFDASQSTSGEMYFDDNEINDQLNEVGFSNYGITSMETFNYSCQSKNAIPKEYLIYPVDERVDIFEKYDDSIYDRFINKAKEIFKKYNKEQKCHPDNAFLFFEPDDKKCYKIEGDEHAHGGYPCGSNGEWNTNICVPFYCDIGYYFDTYQKRCILDVCTEGKKDDGNGGLEVYVIILIAVGSALILGIIIVVIILFRKRKSSRESKNGNIGILVEDKAEEE